MERNEYGQFITQGKDTKYKAVQYVGQRMSEHQRSFCIALGIDKIPHGFVVHHLDKNPRNNDINNLALLTITAHNRIHSHEPWNKGLNTRDSEKWNKTIQKAVATRKGNYLATKGMEVYELNLRFCVCFRITLPKIKPNLWIQFPILRLICGLHRTN